MAKRANAAQQRMYGEFAAEFERCWACWWMPGQATGLPRLRLEIAHLVGGPGRRHDRRDIARLCSVCHLLNHGATIRGANNEPLPHLRLEHLLWLKRACDPDHYDLAYLQSLRVRCAEPLIPEELPQWYASQQELRNAYVR